MIPSEGDIKSQADCFLLRIVGLEDTRCLRVYILKAGEGEEIDSGHVESEALQTHLISEGLR